MGTCRQVYDLARRLRAVKEFALSRTDYCIAFENAFFWREDLLTEKQGLECG